MGCSCEVKKSFLNANGVKTRKESPVDRVDPHPDQRPSGGAQKSRQLFNTLCSMTFLPINPSPLGDGFSKLFVPHFRNSCRHFVSEAGCTPSRRTISAASFIWIDSTTTRNLNSPLCFFGVFPMRSSHLLVSDLTPLLVYLSGLVAGTSSWVGGTKLQEGARHFKRRRLDAAVAGGEGFSPDPGLGSVPHRSVGQRTTDVVARVMPLLQYRGHHLLEGIQKPRRGAGELGLDRADRIVQPVRARQRGAAASWMRELSVGC